MTQPYWRKWFGGPRTATLPSRRRRRAPTRLHLEALEDRLAPSITTLASFAGSNGANPAAGLVRDQVGNLFGTTRGGGAHDAGTVFEIAVGTNAITTLASFDGATASQPRGSVVLDDQGDLFGTAAGGANNHGLVFEVVAGSGAITPLASFSGTDGTGPAASIRDGNGNLFGMTGGGGANDLGTVFEVRAGSGAITPLAPFDSASGAGSEGTLALGSHGNLFGTTSGTVFELVAGGSAITPLASLSDSTFSPDVVLDSAGNLFGTTYTGGASHAGTVFELAAGNHTLATLASFSGTNGAQPLAGLVADGNGDLFGTTSAGGAGHGTVFELLAGSHTVTTLAAFDGSDGVAGAAGALVLDGSGNLLGTTEGGGAALVGTVFQVPLPAGNTAPGNLALTPGATALNEGDTLSVRAAFTDPDLSQGHTVTFNWGDGSSQTVRLPGTDLLVAGTSFTGSDGSAATVTGVDLVTGTVQLSNPHVYLDNPAPHPSAGGPYTISLGVADDQGGLSPTASASVQVNNVAPRFSTAIADQSALSGYASTFNLGSFTDPGTDNPWAVQVSWGDTTAAGSFNVSTPGALSAAHTYSADGIYTVTASVTDKDGASDTKTFQVDVGAVVRNTNDSAPGIPGSLRDVINLVNAHPDVVHTITFAIPATDPGHVYYRTDGVSGQVSLANVASTQATDDRQIGDIDSDYAHSWWTIKPQTVLPAITVPVVIDGYSQGQGTPLAAGVNTLPLGTADSTNPALYDNRVLRIELDGSALSSVSNPSGLTIDLTHSQTLDGNGNPLRSSTVRGLDVNRFVGVFQGGRAQGGSSPAFAGGIGIQLIDNEGSVVAGNFVGTDVSGTLAPTGTNADADLPANSAPPAAPAKPVMAWGVALVGGSGNAVGNQGRDARTDAADRNLLSATDFGVSVVRSLQFTVAGNLLGTDRNGTHALGNLAGIGLDSTSSGVIGRTGSGAFDADRTNLISGNYYGINPEFTTAPLTISGNWIGPNILGQDGGLGNKFGIATDGNANTAIGLPSATSAPARADVLALGNRIAYNRGPGVVIGDFLLPLVAMNDPVRGNSIHDNWLDYGHLGAALDLLGDYNLGQNFPIAFPPADPTVLLTNSAYAGYLPRSNDAGDFVSSPNHFQHYPNLDDARLDAQGHLIVSFHVDSLPANATYPLTVDFYQADAWGSGQTYLASATYTPQDQASGSDRIVDLTALGAPALAAGQSIVATATDANGNSSEFAPAFTVQSFRVSAGGPYTSAEGAALPLSAAVSSADVPLTYTWTVNGHARAATGANPTLSWAQLQALGIDDGPGQFAVSVQVDDGHGHQTDSPSTTLTLNNTAPTATLSVPAVVDEGSALVVALLNATDPSATDLRAGLHYAFAVDVPTLAGATYAAGTADAQLGLTFFDGPGTHTVVARVIDKDGGASEYHATVHVNNVAPTVAFADDLRITGGTTFSRSGSFRDPGLLDAPWTATVDYGDGSGVQPLTLNADKTFGLQHAYASAARADTVTVKVTDKDGGVGTGTFALLPGVPASITATGGNNQSTAVDTAFAQPLQATVKDVFGNPVRAAAVTFSAPASGTFSNHQGTSTVLTSAAGIASAGFQAGTVAGTFPVQATVAGVVTPAVFQLTVKPGAPATVTATAGSPQSATVGMAFSTALQATVTDRFGNPVPGVPVKFQLIPGGQAGGTLSAATATTDATGVARVTVTANDVAGSYRVRAKVPGTDQDAVFELTNDPAAPASITVSDGNNQSAAVTTAFEVLHVTIRDTFGNLVPGAAVTFTAPAGGGTFSNGQGALTVSSTASGVAAAVFTAGTVAGGYNVRATVGTVATVAVFSLTVKPGAPAHVRVVGGTPQHASAGSHFAAALQVQVTDPFGNAVAGAHVAFTVIPNHGAGALLSAGSASTDATGLAAVQATANLLTGSYQVQARVSGVVANAVFNLTNDPAPHLRQAARRS